MLKYSKVKKKYAILYLLPISNLRFTIPFESYILPLGKTVLENAIVGKSRAFTVVLIIYLIVRVPIIINTAIMSKVFG